MNTRTNSRGTSAQYAAVRHRKAVRAAEQEAANEEKMARRLETLFGFEDEAKATLTTEAP